MCTLGQENMVESFDLMMQKNFYSALIATYLAYHHLKENGLLLLTGALHAFNNQDPSMASYILSKNLVHNLHMTVAKDNAFKGDILTILPTVIDTESNRASMPKSDTSTWIPPQKIADLMHMWITSENRPKKGAFVELNYEEGAITTKFH